MDGVDPGPDDDDIDDVDADNVAADDVGFDDVDDDSCCDDVFDDVIASGKVSLPLSSSIIPLGSLSLGLRK